MVKCTLVYNCVQRLPLGWMKCSSQQNNHRKTKIKRKQSSRKTEENKNQNKMRQKLEVPLHVSLSQSQVYRILWIYSRRLSLNTWKTAHFCWRSLQEASSCKVMASLYSNEETEIIFSYKVTATPSKGEVTKLIHLCCKVTADPPLHVKEQFAVTTAHAQAHLEVRYSSWSLHAGHFKQHGSNMDATAYVWTVFNAE